MQSKRLYSCALPKFLERENQYSSNGCSSCGQACAQVPQRMHGISGAGGGNRAGEPAMMQLVALTTGADRSGKSKPIIGPPITKRLVSLLGVASATTSCIGVPSRTSQLPGCSTFPVSVTIREMTGSPKAMARQAE